MRASFAALEHRVNTVVLRSLSNRSVRVPSLGLDFDGMFNDASADALNGMVETTQPRLTIAAGNAAQLVRSTPMEILNPATGEFVIFQVATLDPDGAGFVVVSLRKA